MSGMSFNSENNFYYSPMAYTARCSSVVPSPTPIVRPNGMYKSSGDSLPQFQPTRKLDYELELAFFISNPVPSGTIVSPESAEEHIFGYVLMNDWSARDIQMYESLPVGPLNCKAFGTTISPWVVMPEALAHARTEPRNQRARKDQIPAHLKQDNLSQSTYEITCHAFLQRSGSEVAKPVSTSSTAHMFWSPGQLLAHRASTGCGLLTGELIGLGTVSSPEELWPDKSLERRGCLFEITNDGKEDVNINDIGGRWLEDGDIVVLEAWAPGDDGVKIGFGKVSGRVLPETSSSMLKTTNKNGTHI
ncbi:hypothetical protein H2198_010490 [Neophaeococcomyces mojaviensis]|uniref:Uncharacterized protein n=1 Tax=Neophaeococcomyces mojaviensis TaxID=3383035 RepID=A0ACC2ZRD5_9EURO|nr:hypothetical protein H2198_010490 [Knufia sp. JES_112]